MKKSTCIPSVEGEDHVVYTKLKRRTLLTKIIMRSQLLIVMLFMACLHTFGKASAQSVTIVAKQESLVKVLKQVELQTGYIFAYKADAVNGLTVSLNLKAAPLDIALKEIFKNLPIHYNIIEKSIVLAAKPGEKVAEEDVQVQQQQRIITGTVTDSLGNGLAGINVKVKGSNIGTTTNETGYFELNVPTQNAILIFSSVGFQAMEVPLNNQQRLRVILTELTMQIKTVEIQTGYERIKPERFVGSATVVDSAILTRSVGRDLLSRLDGTTNGLLFNKSTNSGSIRMQLRGVSTLNSEPDLNGLSSQNPLIILDDFPFTGDIRNINPNEIASVTVLKDAVAASIWGARAGNGVLVIKTKKGNYNKPVSITINSNLTMVDKPNPYYFPRISSSDFIDVEQTLFDKGFFNVNMQFPQLFSISPVVSILDQVKKGTLPSTDGMAQVDALRKIDLRDDVKKYIYRRAYNKQNYINVAGGTAQSSYNLSFGADNNMSNIKGPGGSNRYTVSSNVATKMLKILELNIGADYNTETFRSDALSYPLSSVSRRSIYPYARLADEDGNALAIPTSFGQSFLNALPTDKMLDWTYRPLDELRLQNQSIRTDLMRLTTGVNLRILPWLSGLIKYQYTNQNVNDRDLNDANSYFARDLVNKFTNKTTFVRSIPVGGILDQTSNSLFSHNLRAQLNVQQNWGGKHDFTALMASEFSKSSRRLQANRFYGYQGDVLGYNTSLDYITNIPLYVSGRARIPNMNSLGQQQSNLVSILANASYTYDSRYAIYASARRDGSNLFGVETNNKYKPLWSVGTRWNISNEAFYHLNWLSNLSFRATYGYAGNINNSVSALATIVRYPDIDPFGEQTVYILTAPNPDLRWEEVRTFNLGLDFEVLRGRLAGTMEYYRKQSKDVIGIFPVDPTLGISDGSMSKNAANLKGNGFDLGVQTRNLVGILKWTTNINLNYSKTVVSRYFEEVKTVSNSPVIREGDIYMGIYAYKWAGLDPNNGDPRGYVGKDVSTDYQGVFNDNIDNQQYIGSAFPLIFGNVMNTFTYKGVSLSANVSYRAKYYFRKPTINYTDLYQNWVGHGDFTQRWQKPGDELYTNIPSMPYPINADRDFFFANSSVNVEKGDHIRLQDVRLSYRWNPAAGGWLRTFKSLELYGYAGNLNAFLWRASKSGYDPDLPTDAVLGPKSFSIGINIGL